MRDERWGGGRERSEEVPHVQTPGTCSGGKEAFPEREPCHLQGPATWITTRKGLNVDQGGVDVEEKHVLGGPRAAQVSPRFGTIGNRYPRSRGVGKLVRLVGDVRVEDMVGR